MLGEQLIKLQAYNETRPWVQESVKRLNFDSFNINKISLEFMELLAEDLLKTGDVNSALKVVQIILNNDPMRKGNVAKMFENTENLPETGNIETDYHVTYAEIIAYNFVLLKEILFFFNFRIPKSLDFMKKYAAEKFIKHLENNAIYVAAIKWASVHFAFWHPTKLRNITLIPMS